MERWVGRVALVTGASVGIGAYTVRRLVAEGMKVVGIARNVEKIKVLAEELKDQPGSLTAIQCDITKDDQVLNVFAQIKRDLGGVDVCINNAGMSRNSTLLEGTPEEWREMLDVNVVALSLCMREAVASMRARGIDDGQIININSLSGHRVVTTSPRTHFYSATKYAVTALTEGLRQELVDAKSNIRVAAVSPGLVETEFATRMNPDNKDIYKQRPSLQSEDIVSSIIHVLSAPPHMQIHDILVRPTRQIF